MSDNTSAVTKNNEFGDMIRNALILFVITLVAGILLGLVYQVTKDPIARQQALKIEAANKEVFATADSFGEEMVDTASAASLLTGDANAAEYANVSIDSVIEARDASGAVLGYVLQVSSGGYNDDIVFSMGITNDGILNGISLISINETPGLGMNTEKVLVPQFKVEGGISALQNYTVVKDGTGSKDYTDSKIEAISGATISSNAVTHGVDAGLLYFNSILKGGQ